MRVISALINLFKAPFFKALFLGIFSLSWTEQLADLSERLGYSLLMVGSIF